MMRRAQIALVIVLTAGTASAGAEPVSPLARQLSDRGRALHDLGDYEQAIVAYKQAYLIAPSPGILFNLAQAYRLAGDCGEAASMYRRYLQSSPDADARKVAESHLAVVDSCVRAGSSAGTGAQLHATIPRDVTPDEPGRGKRRLGMIIVGGGGLLLAAGAYYALDARSAADQVASAYEHGGSWKQIAAIDERGQQSSEIATGLVIAGGAAVASGVVLYLLGRHDDLEAGRAPVITVAPTAHGGANVGLAWRF